MAAASLALPLPEVFEALRTPDPTPSSGANQVNLVDDGYVFVHAIPDEGETRTSSARIDPDDESAPAERTA